MGMGRCAAFAIALLLPLGALGEGAPAEQGEATEEPCGTAICGGDEAEVTGGPLDLSHLGKIREIKVVQEPAFETGPSWGLREHQLYVVPAGSHDYVADSGDLPLIPRPAWPGKHQLHDWDFAQAYSYPELTRSVNFAAFTYMGSDGHNDPVFAERVRANLYLLEAGVTFFDSLGNKRDNRTDMDLDLRVPFNLGHHHQLAVLPGITFPIDSRSWSARNSSVRAQAIYGLGTHGFALQLRAGVVQGSRRAGLLKLRERLEEPAALYGALIAWRFLPAIQIRAEASGEIASDHGPDRLSLLPGLAFFPFADPRVTVGATAVIETVARNLSFTDAAYGGLVNVEAGFY